MKPNTIVYTSNTGHTEQYAKLLGKRMNLPVYSLVEAVKQVKKGTPVLYLGWLHASKVKGYKEAVKRFQICAVCGVGLCDTGTLLAEVRKATSLPETTPLFTIQGGMEHAKLKGFDKLMIRMLTKGLLAKKQRSEQEGRMLELLQNDANYVSEEHLAEVLAWYKEVGF